MANIDLTAIVQAFIALLATVVTCYLIPWIRARTNEKQRDYIRSVIRALVYAAEQLYGAGNGKKKLEYVCEELELRGYDIDLSEIEASVYDAFNQGRGIIIFPENDDGEDDPGTDGAEAGETEDDAGTGKTEMA